MLYIFYGTDETISREKARELIGGLQKKAPDAELVRVTDNNEDALNIDELINTQGLFKQNYIIFLDGVDDVILGFSDIQLEAMKLSKNICVVLMGKLKIGDKRHLEKHTDKITEYSLERSKSKVEFNVFNIANALKSRNKQQLWTTLTEARITGIKGEAITGMMFWAVKDMLIKGQTNKYSKQELESLIIKIAELPHKARRDGVSVHNYLEKLSLRNI